MDSFISEWKAINDLSALETKFEAEYDKLYASKSTKIFSSITYTPTYFEYKGKLENLEYNIRNLIIAEWPWVGEVVAINEVYIELRTCDDYYENNAFCEMKAEVDVAVSKDWYVKDKIAEIVSKEEAEYRERLAIAKKKEADIKEYIRLKKLFEGDKL